MNEASDERPWQMWSSLALDGEIAHDEMLSLLDALARDPQSRDHWIAARRTQQRIEHAFAPDAAATPVASIAPRSPAPRTRFQDLRVTALAQVAVLVLLVATLARLAAAPASFETTVHGTATAERSVSVRVGEHPDRMDEARFVGLAVELLQADRRYQEKMQEILEEVSPSRPATEYPAEPRRLHDGEDLVRADTEHGARAHREPPFEHAAMLH